MHTLLFELEIPLPRLLGAFLDDADDDDDEDEDEALELGFATAIDRSDAWRVRGREVACLWGVLSAAGEI